MENSTAFDNLNTREPELQPNSSTSSANPHLWDINWVRDVFCLAIILVVVLLAWWLRVIIRPVLLALLLAYLINPIIVWCERKWRWPRLSCIVALCAVAAAAVMGLAAAVLPIAVAQAQELVSDLPEYADALGKRCGITEEAVLKRFREKTAEFARNPGDSASYLWDGVVTTIGLMSGVVGTATSKALGVALFPVCLLYFSWRWPTITAWPVAFIPASRRKQVNEIAQKMDEAVGGYFRTRLMIALIMGVMYAIGWGIAGVPYWLLVGMLAGLLGIIPYAATFAWIIAMLLRFLGLEAGITGTGDALAVFLWPSLVFGIVQASDDWLLTPWLQGSQLEMNFVTIILVVVIGGAIAGLLGMLLAVPTAACLRICWAEVVKPRLVRYAESN
jgi:predicted PurR-regulated permease PerM